MRCLGVAMVETPGSSPMKSETSEHPEEHRSFRLTRTTGNTDEQTRNTLKNAVEFSVVLQLAILVVSALILDGGLIFKRVVIASIAYWAFVAIIVVRRTRNPNEHDFAVVKWAFLPILGVVCVGWVIGMTILNATN